ncbi:hypothetical protein ACQ4PT_049322 [Festuca glaucescens]
MTPDEIRAKEAELPDRAKELDEREAELQRQTSAASKEKGNKAATEKPTIAASPPPNPSTYATSIKQHVSITLDLTTSNYTNWRELLLIALGRYGLTSHVVGDDGATPSDTSPTSDWGRDDYTVLSWIYGSISADLFGIVMRPGFTARVIWDAIENLFRDNKKHRAIQLEAEFRNTPQGDMAISDYCAKLKALADALVDVGIKISDETLVLSLLRGLNDGFVNLCSFLPFQVPFPTFFQTRSALILEENQKNTDAKNAASTALWASGNSITPSAGGERAPPSGYGGGRGRTPPYTGFNNSYRGGGRGHGGGRGGRGRGRYNPWQFNPWTGAPTRAHLQHHQPVVTPWQQHAVAPWQQQPPAPWQPRPSVPAPCLLGPHPSAPSQAAPQSYHAYGHANNNMQPSSSTHSAVDPALLAALNNMQIPSIHEWYMDSGASSHMASDHGSSYRDRDSSMQ